MLEPDMFYIITQKNTVKTRMLLHAVGQSLKPVKILS